MLKGVKPTILYLYYFFFNVVMRFVIFFVGIVGIVGTKGISGISDIIGNACVGCCCAGGCGGCCAGAGCSVGCDMSTEKIDGGFELRFLGGAGVVCCKVYVVFSVYGFDVFMGLVIILASGCSLTFLNIK